MSTKPDAIRVAQETVAATLVEYGLERLPAGRNALMQFAISDSVRLCVGMPDLRRGGELFIRPTLGVLHDELDKLLKNCHGAAVQRGAPSLTMVRTLGFLLGDQLRTWSPTFADARAIASDIHRVGVPWAHERIDLEACLRYLVEGEGGDLNSRAFRIAGVLHLLGRTPAALQALQEHVDMRASDGVPETALQQFSDFADCLARYPSG